jgi:hypothetical protein
MLITLPHIRSFMEPGIYLCRDEVIKRYRSSRHFSPYVLQVLLLYSFSFVYKSSTGEMSAV